MNGLDRDKAREVLGVWDDGGYGGDWGVVLDRLDACVVQAPPQRIEGRDRVCNPDGTFTYWQAKADDARTKLARIATLPVHRKHPGALGWISAEAVEKAMRDAT